MKKPLHQRWQVSVVCLLLGLGVWFVFGQTLQHGFVNWDDDGYVYENDVTRSGLTWRGVAWVFTHTCSSNWHPMTMLSHMLDCQLYGLNPARHHATSVLLHGATGILLFLFLRRITGALWRGAFGAGVFAIHPLRVESVAWISERKDVLSGLFFVLTLWAYAEYTRRIRSSNRQIHVSKTFPQNTLPWYLLAVLLFALGLMSKPMLVTVPFVLLLLDYWPLNRIRRAESGEIEIQSLRRAVLDKTPFLALSIADGVVTLLAQKDSTVNFETLPLFARISHGLLACATYVRQTFYPAGLAAFYPHTFESPSALVWSGVALVVGGVSAMAILARRKQPWLITGWLWFLGMLTPVLGVIQVGKQAWADRYTYLPQIGLAIMIAWGACELIQSQRWGRAALGTAAAGALAFLAACAHAQTTYWKDGVSLWTRTLACTSANPLAEAKLGDILMAQPGRIDDAIEHYQRALQFRPRYKEALNNLGLCLMLRGDLPKAAEQYRRAIEIAPDDAAAHYNLGHILARQDQLQGAVEQYELAVRYNPGFVAAYKDLAVALTAQGNLSNATARYQWLAQLQPNDGGALIDLGNALAREGKSEAAAEQFTQAARLLPDNAAAQYDLGLALAEQGKRDEAREHFQQAVRLAEAKNQTSVARAAREQLNSTRNSPAQK